MTAEAGSRPGTRVLVTGASGFIGRALTAHLLASRRFEVRASVRCASTPWPDRIDRMAPVATGDLGPDTNWQDALSGVDTVVHLAARAHVLREATDDPLKEFRRVNVAATMNLAKQAAASGCVRRIVFISSIGVNGTATGPAPFSELDTPGPREDYAVSKLEAEQALRRVAAQSGPEIVIVRPPLVYGPNAPGNFGRLTRLVRRGIPLPLGAVDNRRSLVSLANLIDFIVTCIEHPCAANQTFLVSDGDDLSTTDLVRRMARAMGQRARLMPVPVPILMAGATLIGRREQALRLIGSLQVDISKARGVLGWAPRVSVDDGLRQAMGG